MDDLELKRRRAYANRRSIMDIGMGFIYAAMGGFFLLSKQFGIVIEFPPEPFNYLFGGLCLLYGGFRIYRGFKKNYFRS
ncbi:MAG TPA: hypothetical protein VKA49_15110 [Flavitalea sp.]|nr:hypothetical protein [Flavitalea sp.]